jgi:hypothetical protein
MTPNFFLSPTVEPLFELFERRDVGVGTESPMQANYISAVLV